MAAQEPHILLLGGQQGVTILAKPTDHKLRLLRLCIRFCVAITFHGVVSGIRKSSDSLGERLGAGWKDSVYRLQRELLAARKRFIELRRANPEVDQNPVRGLSLASCTPMLCSRYVTFLST